MTDLRSRLQRAADSCRDPVVARDLREIVASLSAHQPSPETIARIICADAVVVDTDEFEQRHVCTVVNDCESCMAKARAVLALLPPACRAPDRAIETNEAAWIKIAKQIIADEDSESDYFRRIMGRLVAHLELRRQQTEPATELVRALIGALTECRR